MAGKKKIPKEYDKVYGKGKKKMSGEPEMAEPEKGKIGRAGDSSVLDPFQYPDSTKAPPPKPKAPKAKAKAKAKKKIRGPKALIKEGVKNYKAADKYFAEKWKQRDLKKQIAKKKKESQAKRDAKKK